MSIELLPQGDQALVMRFGAAPGATPHQRVLGFCQGLERSRAQGNPHGIAEWLPAAETVTLIFDDTADEAQASARDAGLLELAHAAAPATSSGRGWRLPACFDAEFAPDLAAVAAAHQRTPEAIVQALLDTPLQVLLLGFQPGFPYMGELPPHCRVPRLASPRRQVPERSIAVAGAMCAIYPWASPGGWHLVGRTPVRLFDPREPEPAWLRAGDGVQWQPVSRAEYDTLEQLARDGQLRRERFLTRPKAA